MNASSPLFADVMSDVLPDALDRRIAAFLALALAAFLGFVSYGHVDSLDAEMDFQTARGFAVHRDGAVHDDNPAGVEILTRRSSGLVGRNGKFYSWHGTGRALVGVPFYLVGKLCEQIWPACERLYAESPPERWVTEAAPSELFPRLFFSLSSALFGALAAVCVYLSARVLGARRGAALAAALALIFATWFGPATRSALNAVQTGGLLALGAYGLLRYARSQRDGAVRELSRLGLFVLGAVLGLCAWTRPTEAPAVVALSVLALIAAWRRRSEPRAVQELLAFAAGAALVAAAMFGWNLHRFGDAQEFGHRDAIGPNFRIHEPWHLALNELFLWCSPGKGVLIYAPLLLLLPLLWMARGARLERTVLALAAAACFTWPIFTSGWHGASFYGPRYVTPALPLLAMVLARPIGELWRRGGWRSACVALLFAAGCAVQIPAFLVSHRTVHELVTTVARRELPMPASYVAQFAAASGMTAEQIAGLDEAARAEALRRAEFAYDNETRQQFVQVHPLFFPPRIYAQIAWHRLLKPAPREGELLPFAWISSPLDPPLAVSPEERTAWTAQENFPAQALALEPSGLEMRGFANLWPIAFATRFEGFPIALVAGLAAALVACGALGVVLSMRRARRVEAAGATA